MNSVSFMVKVFTKRFKYYGENPGNIEGWTFFIKLMKKAVMIPSMIITGK